MQIVVKSILFTYNEEGGDGIQEGGCSGDGGGGREGVVETVLGGRVQWG